MLRLRLSDGLDLAQLGARFGARAAAAAAAAVAPHVGAGLAEVVADRPPAWGSGARGHAAGVEGGREGLGGSVVRLTDPEGFLVSNDVISDVFAALVPDDAATHAAGQAVMCG